MKKVLLLVALVASLGLSAQTYVSGSFSYYNGAGSFGAQSQPTVEVGRYLAPDFTAGLAVGFTAFDGGKFYTEFRPTFYYQSGKFSQGFTIGAGAVYDSPSPFMVEWATSSNYQINSKLSAGLSIGAYNFNGKLFASENSYIGTTFSYTFKKQR